MRQSPRGAPRGILSAGAGAPKFQLARYLPAEDLAHLVEHLWVVRWDLRGQEPHRQETLPYPCVHAVIEKGRSQVYGVHTGKFTRLLSEQGQVLGIKFRPGAFYPFVRWPVSRLTNRSVRFSEVFGRESTSLEDALAAPVDEGPALDLAERFLREGLPVQDERGRAAGEIVEWISAHREVTRVDAVAAHFELNKRTLQRLFDRYVGVSPKWVIKRFRVHEVAQRLAEGETVNWPAIVAELGYTDHAHFINDFKSIVGHTPAAYLRRLAAPR
jgi:AraC-like DNA-binding protein